MQFITDNDPDTEVSVDQLSAELNELLLPLRHDVAVLLGPGDDVMEGDQVMEHLSAVTLIVTTSAKAAVIKRSLGSVFGPELCDVLQAHNRAGRLGVVTEIVLEAVMIRTGLYHKVCHC